MTCNSANINDSGLPIFDSSLGQFDAVDAASKGDLLIHDGSSYDFLPVGSDGKVLTLDSGQTSGFSWSDLPFTGDWILLDDAEASDSSFVNFTDLDTTTYSSFHLRLINIHPATNNDSLEILFSTDNGSSFLSSGYSWVYRAFDTGSGTDYEGHSSSASVIQSAESVGNDGGEGVAGWIFLLPSQTPAQMKHAAEWSLYSKDGGGDLNWFWGGGINSTSDDIDAIRIKFASGNIEAGKIYLYGVSAS